MGGGASIPDHMPSATYWILSFDDVHEAAAAGLPDVNVVARKPLRPFLQSTELTHLS